MTRDADSAPGAPPAEELRVESLAPESRSALPTLAGRPWARDVYLAGSAALALYCGHRQVRDLDLMSSSNRLDPASRRDLMQDLLRVDPAVRVETARNGFLYVRLGAGNALKFYYYPYPQVDPGGFLEGLEIASRVDLGLMKLGAVISRGTRRDFADLYLLCRQTPLEELLDRSADKFGHVRDFPLQALKGLADLSQVEGEPMPSLQPPVDWSEIVAWLNGSVRDLARERLGLR